jgi:Domain of unknown function (DUF4337)
MHKEITPEGLEVEFDKSNTQIGILIAVMAAALAIAEAATHSAQVEMLRDTIQASDTWAFFQAKTIRGTVLKAHAQEMEAQSSGLPPGPPRDAIAKAIADWRANAARYESEPSTGEGRKELAARAHKLEEDRDRLEAGAEKYETGSAALQLAIVLASSAVVTKLRWLAIGGGLLGCVGAAIALLGWLAPHFLAG